ncbi:MAG: VWA domain-containing protein, partial [Vulcanimicrobiaceae bacterium]
MLREEHGFALGPAHVLDAIRALEAIGIDDRARVQTALRLTCCGSPDERATFDRAFAAFFDEPSPGVAQPYAPRHSRPGRDERGAGDERGVAEPGANTEEDGSATPAAGERRVDDENDELRSWRTLRARYSPAAVRAARARLAPDAEHAMERAAARFVAAARTGRARRLRAAAQGLRLDGPRTLRASLRTGGEPFVLHRRGRPPRAPRFVFLIDGSRSMAEHTDAVVAFARAVSSQTRRASVFTFSTELREVTGALRAPGRAAIEAELGAAWHGGTRIGAALTHFLTTQGDRLLSRDTIVLIASDGLDVGDVER